MAEDKKKLQLEMLSILKKIDEVCKMNDIKYTLAYGTALGAVRHKGFIPWDDDADISMLWEDYKKFIKIWKKENLDEIYFLQSYKTEKKYPMLYTKIRSKTVEAREKIFEGLDMQETAWVDIFPVINASNNKFLEKLQWKLVLIANFINHKHYYLNANEFVRKNHNHLKLKRVMFRIVPDFICKGVVTLLLNVAGSFKKTNNVVEVGAYETVLHKTKSKFFEESEYVKFENEELLLTKEWDEYLTFVYGDYMTPKKYDHELL